MFRICTVLELNKETNFHRCLLSHYECLLQGNLLLSLMDNHTRHCSSPLPLIYSHRQGCLPYVSHYAVVKDTALVLHSWFGGYSVSLALCSQMFVCVLLAWVTVFLPVAL